MTADNAPKPNPASHPPPELPSVTSPLSVLLEAEPIVTSIELPSAAVVKADVSAVVKPGL